MGRGKLVDEVIDVPKLSRSDLAEQLIEAVRTTQGCSTASATMDRITFTRSYRPLPVLVAGWLLCWTLVGLLLFLVKTSERFSVAFVDDHTGLRVHLSGRMLPELRTRMAAIATGRVAPAPPPVELPSIPAVPVRRGVPALLGEAPVDTEAETRDVPRSPAPHSPVRPIFHDPSGAADATQHRVGASDRRGHSLRVALYIADGRSVMVESIALIGRDPVPRDDEATSVTLVTVDDDSVSKTHASVIVEGGAVWVVDRISTNGTFVVGASGDERVAEPGVRCRVEPGERIRLGRLYLRVVEA